MSDCLSNEQREALESVYGRAREIGLLGPVPVRNHIEHASIFFDAWNAARSGIPPKQAIDIGSGAGVPGLVLAMLWPDSSWILMDAGKRRIAFLEAAINELGIATRVCSLRGRAEELAHDTNFRQKLELVTARGFGAPAITAECSSGFLKKEGLLIVSEPPEETARWDEDGLALLGMKRIFEKTNGAGVILQYQVCESRYPRRTGIPSKRPLFG